VRITEAWSQFASIAFFGNLPTLLHGGFRFLDIILYPSVVVSWLAVVLFYCAFWPRDHQVEYKSSSGDETPEHNVTYHLIWLLIYDWTTTHLYFRNIFYIFTRTCCIPSGRKFTKSTSVSRYYSLSVFLTILLSGVSQFIREVQLM